MARTKNTRIPVRPTFGAWPTAVERRFARFFRPDPKVLLDSSVSAEQFSAAMSAIHVGDTVKITERHRHPVADDLLLEHLNLTDATIVDMGASDGSTAVDLIQRLPSFGSYVVADLFLTVSATPVLGHVVFHDDQDRPLLVSGPGWAAWPGLSRGVRALCRPLELAAARCPERRKRIRLLNPELQSLMTDDPRITDRIHDVFTPWPRPAPDVIKVANLLRRVYFTDEEIDRALLSLFDSLEEGGHLLVVDDGQRYTTPVPTGAGARAGLYRRDIETFSVVAETAEQPEIADQVRRVRRERR